MRGVGCREYIQLGDFRQGGVVRKFGIEREVVEEGADEEGILQLLGGIVGCPHYIVDCVGEINSRHSDIFKHGGGKRTVIAVSVHSFFAALGGKKNYSAFAGFHSSQTFVGASGPRFVGIAAGIKHNQTC